MFVDKVVDRVGLGDAHNTTQPARKTMDLIPMAEVVYSIMAQARPHFRVHEESPHPLV